METEGKMEWDSMELSPSQAQQAHEPRTSHYNSTPALSSLGPMAQDLEIKCFFVITSVTPRSLEPPFQTPLVLCTCPGLLAFLLCLWLACNPLVVEMHPDT